MLLKFLTILLTLLLCSVSALRNCQYARGYQVLHCFNVEIDYLRMIQDEPRRKGYATLVSYLTLHYTKMEELTRDFLIKNLPDVLHVEIHDSLTPVRLEKGMFRKHPDWHLNSLTIKNSPVEGVIEQDLWNDNDRLREIIFSGVPVRSLHDQFNNTHLEVLVLDNAEITEIDHVVAFYHLRELQVLHLTNNLIEALNSRTFNQLAKLKELSVAYNRIYCLFGTEFDDLVSLERLDLSGNPLKMIDLEPIANPIPNIQLVKIHHLPCETLKRVLSSLRHFYNDEEVDCKSLPLKNKKCKFVSVKTNKKEYAVGEILMTRPPPYHWWQSTYESIPCIDFMNLFDEYEGDMFGIEHIAGEPLIHRSAVLSYRIENIDDRDFDKKLKTMVSDLRLGNYKLKNYINSIRGQIPYYLYY